MWAENDLDICKKKMLEDISSKLAIVKVDERGKAVDFRQMLLAELHVVTVEPGACRGNHVHDKDEIICVMGGHDKCEIIAECETPSNKEGIIVENNLSIYKISAGIRHSVKDIGDSTFYLVCFYISHS